MVHSVFKNKTVNFDKLLQFGFEKNREQYVYTAPIMGKLFELKIIVTSEGSIITAVTDLESEEEYILHLTDAASGAFVGKIRTEYQDILQKVADSCFDPEVFKSEVSRQVIQYVREKYLDELEFLWEKFSQNAIVRRKDNNKWYAAFLTVSKRKLGLDSDGIVEIIDLREETGKIEALVDFTKYFPGYHMNKKHWLTIRLDGSVSADEICRRIDKSYLLAKK